ncbi:MAG: hypothetical protein NTNFB02_25610 [Nitrospira sp.]
MGDSMRKVGVILIVTASCFWSVPAVFGISLEEAKAKGLVGEKGSGYLGVVTPSGQDVQVLVNDVNKKRRQAYEDIAKRNKTPLDAVETLAGEKAIQNTRPGNYVEGPGGWVKK